jgi:nucleotide-binding universal stress UspA family protein
MSRIRCIMCATELSHASGPAFTKAVELAKLAHAELILVHAFAPLVPLVGEGTYIPPRTWDEIQADLRAAAQNQLDALVRLAKKAGVRRTTSLLAEGVAADQIIRAAKARHADLLVLGTHGRTGLRRVFLGSVASRVVATARCPVLTVRGE